MKDNIEIQLKPADWNNIPQIIPKTISKILQVMTGLQHQMNKVNQHCGIDQQNEQQVDARSLRPQSSELVDLKSKVSKVQAQIRKLKKAQEALVRKSKQEEMFMKGLYGNQYPDNMRQGQRDDIPVLSSQSSIIADSVQSDVRAHEAASQHLNSSIEDLKIEEKAQEMQLDLFKKQIQNAIGDQSIDKRLTSLRTDIFARITQVSDSYTKLSKDVEYMHQKIAEQVQTTNQQRINKEEKLLMQIKNIQTSQLEQLNDIKKLQLSAMLLKQKFKTKSKYQLDKIENIQKEVKQLRASSKTQLLSTQTDLIGQINEVHQEMLIGQQKSAREIQEINNQINEQLTTFSSKLTETLNQNLQDSQNSQQQYIMNISQEITQKITNIDSFVQTNFQEINNTINIHQNNLDIIKSATQGLIDQDGNTTIITDARIYTLEAKLKSEEQNRLELGLFLKETLQKLMYSLEQFYINSKGRIKGYDSNMLTYIKRLSYLKQQIGENLDQQVFMGRRRRGSSQDLSKFRVDSSNTVFNIETPVSKTPSRRLYSAKINQFYVFLYKASQMSKHVRDVSIPRQIRYMTPTLSALQKRRVKVQNPPPKTHLDLLKLQITDQISQQQI